MVNRRTKQLAYRNTSLYEPIHIVAFFFGLTFPIHTQFNGTHKYNNYKVK